MESIYIGYFSIFSLLVLLFSLTYYADTVYEPAHEKPTELTTIAVGDVRYVDTVKIKKTSYYAYVPSTTKKVQFAPIDRSEIREYKRVERAVVHEYKRVYANKVMHLLFPTHLWHREHLYVFHVPESAK